MNSNSNLPDEVVARLNAITLDELTTSRGGSPAESRSATIEVRAVEGSDTVGIHGYATVYGYPYDVAGGPANGGWSETIARGSCDKSLSESADVRFLVNHEGTPIARTKSGTLILTSDEVGLRVDVPSIDRRSTVANDLAIALERGDVDEMSYAFRVIRQEWNHDYSERTIREVQLYDVSAVTYPANPATVVALRAEEPDVNETSPVPLAGGLSLAAARALILSLDHI